MLKAVQDKLAEGPFETTVAFHGVNTMLQKKATILSVDAVGAVLAVKGAFGGVGTPRFHPWSAIMFIDL